MRVFYEIWDAPLYTIGGEHLITQAIAVCGGENVFAALTLPAPAVSVEAVLAAKPDAIIAGADGAVRPAWLDDWKRWPSLPAVAHGNLLRRRRQPAASRRAALSRRRRGSCARRSMRRGARRDSRCGDPALAVTRERMVRTCVPSARPRKRMAEQRRQRVGGEDRLGRAGDGCARRPARSRDRHSATRDAVVQHHHDAPCRARARAR